VNAGAVAADANTRKLSVRGAVSIQVYGLNRLALVQSRTRVLRRLEFLADIVVELHAIAEQVRGNAPVAKRIVQLADRVAAEIRNAADPTEPHSAVAVAWLKRFEARLEA
jgi:hypothetical protein